MKPQIHLPLNRCRSRGFTLVELLIVIAIIGILAAMLLPAIAMVKKRAMVKRAQLEANNIKNAITAYESAYSRWPASTEAADAAANADTDFTFGDSIGGKSVRPVGLKPLQADRYKNADIIAILMDQVKYLDAAGGPTIDENHAKNPNKIGYLEAHLVSNPSLPGVGPDLVYRDPWGNPYVITIDLNYDGKARDAVYSIPTVSEDPKKPNQGLNGLIQNTTAPGGPYYELNGPVMVWSAGPDGLFAKDKPADEGVNKDNVLSWSE